MGCHLNMWCLHLPKQIQQVELSSWYEKIATAPEVLVRIDKEDYTDIQNKVEGHLFGRTLEANRNRTQSRRPWDLHEKGTSQKHMYCLQRSYIQLQL